MGIAPSLLFACYYLRDKIYKDLYPFGIHSQNQADNLHIEFVAFDIVLKDHILKNICKFREYQDICIHTEFIQYDAA